MTTTKQALTEDVRQAFDKWGTAWNNGDLDGYLAGYHDSEQTRYVRNSTVIEGKAAIVQMYKQAFPTAEAMGALKVTRLDVEPIGERDALVFGIWEQTKDEITNSGAFTVHVRRINEEWQILSDHTASA